MSCLSQRTNETFSRVEISVSRTVAGAASLDMLRPVLLAALSLKAAIFQVKSTHLLKSKGETLAKRAPPFCPLCPCVPPSSPRPSIFAHHPLC